MTSDYFVPGTQLQVVHTANSLGALQFCPRYYQLSVLEGWGRDDADALRGGAIAHAAWEELARALGGGASEHEALRSALRVLLAHAGCVIKFWQCHKCGCKFLLTTSGKIGCLRCGNDEPGTITRERTWELWEPYEDIGKSPRALVRALVWYCEEFKGHLGQVLKGQDGAPALEIEWKLPLAMHTSNGTRYYLRGYVDEARAIEGERLLVERKTTSKTLSGQYFTQFSPHLQVTMQAWALAQDPQLFGGDRLDGVQIEAIQTGVTMSRTMRKNVYRSPEALEEFERDIAVTLREAEDYAAEGYWPKRERNCFLCSFKKVCTARPDMRAGVLKEHFTRRERDPEKKSLTTREPSRMMLVKIAAQESADDPA